MNLDILREQRKPEESLYLLVNPLGNYPKNDQLSIASLVDSLGSDAITRVARADLDHTPGQWPVLIRVAAPGDASTEHLQLSGAHASRERFANKHYICGWLLSAQPAEIISQHLVQQCQALQLTGERALAPWYEPIRLALLGTAMKNVGELLGPIRMWSYPNLWGGITTLETRPTSRPLVVPELAKEVQRFAPQITQLLAAWYRLNRSQHTYAPWRFAGTNGLPNHAPSHAFNLIYDAHQRGLRHHEDIQCLCLHRVLVHPLLLQHPIIQSDVEQAVSGKQSLSSRFAHYDDAAWKQIVSALPEARSYS